MVVVMISCFVRNNIDLLEPFNHAAANVSRNNEAHRESMVRLQPFSIGLVRNDNVIGRVHCPRQWHRCPILDALSPGFFLERPRSHLVGQIFVSNKFHVLASHVSFRNTGLQQQVTQQDTLPNIGGNSRGSPVKTNRLSDQVLFLAAVSGAHQGDGQLSGWHGRNLVHGEFQWIRHERPSHSDGVVFPSELGAGGMIAHIMQRRRSNKLVLVQDRQGRFHIEGVLARQTYQATITGHPFVGCFNITDIRWAIEHGLGFGNIRNRAFTTFVTDFQKGNRNGAGVRSVEFLARRLLSLTSVKGIIAHRLGLVICLASHVTLACLMDNQIRGVSRRHDGKIGSERCSEDCPNV
mmetsp:Transcript_22528/g.49087  ORF Transcript_22528/g.49087 Transcript_22528/m.49087 type:complete len:350 (-) Transcript_22528:153-1202(-)